MVKAFASPITFTQSLQPRESWSLRSRQYSAKKGPCFGSPKPPLCSWEARLYLRKGFQALLRGLLSSLVKLSQVGMNGDTFSIKACNPKVLGESPKMANSQKWFGEGATGSLSSGSKSLPRVFCTVQNLFCAGAAPFCTGATPFSFLGLKRPFAPSPKHFWEFSIFGLSLPELSDCK